MTQTANGERHPAAGAHVALENAPTTVKADVDGRFVLRGLPAGLYDLRISWSPQPGSPGEASGLRVRNVDLSKKLGDVNLGTVDIGGLGSVQGVVEGDADGALLAVVEGVGKVPVQDGVFALEAMAAGEYEVSLVGDAGVWPGGSVTVKPRMATSMKIDAAVAPETTGSVTGVAGRADGQPLAGVSVFLVGEDKTQVDAIDGSGRWSVSSLTAGVYSVVVKAPGMLTTQRPFVVVAGASFAPFLMLVPAGAGCSLGGEGIGEPGDEDGDGVPDVDEPEVCLCHPGFVDADEDGVCDDPNEDKSQTPECATSSDCADNEAGKHCLVEAGTCVECLDDEHCDGGASCNAANTCEVVSVDPPGCQAKEDCGPDEFCNDENTCETIVAPPGCQAKEDCGPDEFCNDENTCETIVVSPECYVNEDCSSDRPVCAEGVCACGAHADCGTGRYCGEDGACGGCEETNANLCGTESSAPGCEVCTNDTPVCEAGSCVCGSQEACGVGHYCNDGGACDTCEETNPERCGTALSAAGCEVCSGQTPMCSGGACVECLKHADCPSGHSCTAGRCVDREWPQWPTPLDIPTPDPYTGTGTTVTDSVTGLEWQYEPPTGGYQFASANTYCANLALGGKSDWRLPTHVELLSIVDFGFIAPAIDQEVFKIPGGSYEFWSSSPSKKPSYTWMVSFQNHGVNHKARSSYSFVRCVRGGKVATVAERFTAVPADECHDECGFSTVVDNVTHLTWQREPALAPMKWQEANDYCEGADSAPLRGWRLPTVKELRTLVDIRSSNPAIDQEVFPGVASGEFWSSSLSVYGTLRQAVITELETGGSHNVNINGVLTRRAWCVRKGGE